MIYIRKLWNLLMYAGIEKAEYDKLRPVIRKKNQELLKVFSLLGAAIFLVLFVVSAASAGFASVNSSAYLLCASGMLVILIGSLLLLPNRLPLTVLFVFLFEILLYFFGIRISLLHADKVAVSAVAFLLVSPLLFYDRPIRLSVLTISVVSVFCVIVSRFKSPDVAETDIWNMITFGGVAILTTVFMMSIKVHALHKSEQVEQLSQTDLLTGVKNRNHYESRLMQYPGLSSSNLICVYADANGLHEMNNREGHSAGDRMLCEVAAALQKHFGTEHTYRVGGDEFVAFRTDGHLDSLSSEIAQIKQELKQKGYHVSIGVATRRKADSPMHMHEIVNEAESNMFNDKREFYSRSEHNRRSRAPSPAQ